MSWDTHHQTFFLTKNFLFLSMKHMMSAVVHHNISLYTKKQHRTVGIPCNLQLDAAGFILNRMCKLAVPHSIFTCRYVYIPQDFTLLFIIIFLTFPQQQVMAPQTHQWRAIKSESSWKTVTSSNVPLAETQCQRRHQWVHCDGAIAATENMTQDTHLKTVCKVGHSKNKKQYVIGCE